ncbi:pilin N-terminal domain-containing protein [Levilactobacillus yiduensis]|uniref:pilin N-terminal domain-containing protein n=1 Tax=Levilactobacillus yiduensis TaxID=2953880 RepID=UPI000EF2DF98|nr:pilin N-terminal domain-containing protein [Levilactobacillus yiduensis]AYM01516.1 LPXTG cell wall anchor domain-containing protein [Levilactobacillus brevis]
MKITKLRQLAVAAFAVCGLALGGGQLTAHAAEAAPDTVTLKLHKLDNTADKTIQNTGDEVDTQGLKPYDASKYGAVTYSVYDITALLKARDVVAGQTDQDTFKQVRDELIQEITNGQTDPEKVLAAQQAFVDQNDLQATATQTLTDSSGLLTFAGLSNKGFYLIMETAAPVDHLTGMSAPMIIGLPLNDKDTIHLYPKNVVASGIDPTIHKVGLDPEAPTSDKYVTLEGIQFTLAPENDPDNAITLTTNAQGDIDFGGLEVGTRYVLTESSVASHPWYHLTANGQAISLTFAVDKDGNIKKAVAQPSAGYFKISGSTIGITNHLILGGAEFKKVDAQTGKELAGAKFKVQKVADGEKFWAVFDGKTFEKWVKDEAQATVLTSGSDGKFDFTGVPYVYDKHDKKQVVYNLIETQAPAGYALLKSATPFEINEKTEIKDIENERYALPITGGMGIWLFLLIGGLLMGGSGYLYYRQRRQNKA